MEIKTKEALIRWVKGDGPESPHWYDKQRFYNVVFECLKNGDYVDSDELIKIISENHKWGEDKIQSFSEDTAIDVEKIIGFINFLKTEKQINIYNLL